MPRNSGLFVQAGVIHLIPLLLVALIVAAGFFAWSRGFVKLPFIASPKEGPSVTLTANFKNPFDKSSQYINPFGYKNPFDNLK